MNLIKKVKVGHILLVTEDTSLKLRPDSDTERADQDTELCVENIL